MLRPAVAVLLIALLPSYVRADARFALLIGIGALPTREYVMIACPTTRPDRRAADAVLSAHPTASSGDFCWW